MPVTLYSPNQVLAAAFLGGPLAALYALKRNFDTLGNPAAGALVVRWGMAMVVALLSMLPFLPQDFPQLLLPLAYSFAARAVASASQLSREQIAADPERYQFLPLSQLVLHSLLAMMAFMALTIVWYSLLDSAGIIELPEPPKPAPAVPGLSGGT